MIKKIQLNIEGMHCDSCAIGIQMVLENTDGVKKSLVYYDKKLAEVEFDEDKVALKNLIKAISELGYKAAIKN
jgi:copper chaperone CopZ